MQYGEPLYLSVAEYELLLQLTGQMARSCSNLAHYFPGYYIPVRVKGVLGVVRAIYALTRPIRREALVAVLAKIIKIAKCEDFVITNNEIRSKATSEAFAIPVYERGYAKHFVKVAFTRSVELVPALHSQLVARVLLDKKETLVAVKAMPKSPGEIWKEILVIPDGT